MCKFNKKNDSRRIDPCMRQSIKNLKVYLRPYIETVACCCGHGKYPMTIIINTGTGHFVDLISGKEIPRKKKFYKKDKKQYYFIPETLEAKK